jgi:thiamine biosynthesis lipoprotein
MKRIIPIILIFIMLLPLFTACSGSQKETGFIFGTSYTIELTGAGAKGVMDDIRNLLNGYENLWSVSIEDSDLYRVNHSAVNVPVAVDPLTIEMYTLALTLYSETDGALNAAIQPIVKLWGFSPDGANIGAVRVPPTLAEINQTLPYCNFSYFSIDALNNTISRSSYNAMLDFGAIAKGYAAQKALDICREKDLESAVINIGGTVAVLGEKIKAGIRSPRDSSYICVASFMLSDGESAATSGDYERYFEYEGIKYHHIMDSATGAPADNGIISVTIVTSNGELSDALSTAVFCMGVTDGMAYAVSKGAKCLIITSDSKYYISENFEVTILDNSYSEGSE